MTKIASTDLIGLYEGNDYVNRYHDSAGERISRIVDYINLYKKDKVLDIGCGNGLLLPEIIHKIHHYDGVDLSSKFIKEARKRAIIRNLKKSKFDYHCRNIMEFCIHNSAYDKVFAIDFTEHINDKELVAIFFAVKKSMKNGAQLIIHTPNKDYLLERLKSQEHKVNVQGHIGLRNANEYKRIFKKIGFRTVEVIPLNHYLTILKPLHVLSYIPNKKIASIFQARLLIVCRT